MSFSHPTPTPSMGKQLYANANGCAFPRCDRSLTILDAQTGLWSVNSVICHIRARSENGPRWDSAMTSEENRSFENLLLMCKVHAAVIDHFDTADQFSVETLLTWKKRQLQRGADNDFLRTQLPSLDELNSLEDLIVKADLSRADLRVLADRSGLESFVIPEAGPRSIAIHALVRLTRQDSAGYSRLTEQIEVLTKPDRWPSRQ